MELRLLTFQIRLSMTKVEPGKILIIVLSSPVGASTEVAKNIGLSETRMDQNGVKTVIFMLDVARMISALSPSKSLSMLKCFLEVVFGNTDLKRNINTINFLII